MRARFWRNVTLIALAHAGLLVLLLRWAGETKAASAAEITWLSGAAEAEAAETPEPATSASTPDAAGSTPAAKSDIVLPSPTPTPTTAPQPTPEPSVKRTATPKPTAKKKTTPKLSVTPTKNKVPSGKKQTVAKTSDAKKPSGGNAKTSTDGSGEGTSGTGSGKTDAATANYYGNMLHDRFYRAWDQPQTVVASGVKLSAVARIRIEKDGRVSDFKIVKPSGNVLVDGSLEAVKGKVTQVDALPAGMGRGGHYDVNINFELNSK